MTEVEQPPPQNGIDLSAAEDDDNNKARPADIEQDMREMERRKRVEAIMSSKLFREELERIVDSARDGGGILQQLSDIMGVPSTRVGNVFKTTNCMLPINDIRGVESMGYAKGEKILRCKLAATFRLLDLSGWTQGLGAQITARLKVDQENFLVNPYGMMYHEITASSLNKVDMQGQVVEQGTTNFGVNKSHFALHSVVHAARPDIRCAIYIGCSPVVAVSSLKVGLLPLTRDACMLGEVTTHQYTGALADAEERDKLVRALGPVSKVLILSNYGALCCGETIEEAFFAASHIVQACETQLKLLPVGVENLVLIPEESRKIIYEQSRRPPEDLEKKFAAANTTDGGVNQEEATTGAKDGAAVKATGNVPKWRVGGAEFEALMRMLDNAGYRTGYIYRHPLIKSDPPKPKNDVELPPAVSSLGYLLEEEELLRQGIWKKGDLRKGGDRSRWLNSPNVYQKVEVLETGTPDPKKITKWVAEGSPTHSTPVRIEDPLQFVPAGTNPKEFKRLQQQIKDNRRADKISAGPQSHILEGVTWDEANRIKDATVSSAGDHVVLMGAASKGIIQRGFQHNAAVYKAPYAKNPFDNVTDDELNEYKRTVERKKKSIHGEYTDTDFSESEPLSSLQTSGAQQQTKQTTTAAVTQSEPEDVSEHQVMRIETQQAPVPSQPEVVLSDATLSFLNGERSHAAANRKPPTGRDVEDDGDDENEEFTLQRRTSQRRSLAPTINKCADDYPNQIQLNVAKAADSKLDTAANNPQSRSNDNENTPPKDQSNKENLFHGDQNIQRNAALIAELKKDSMFQRRRKILCPSSSSSITTITTINDDGNLNDNDYNNDNTNNYQLCKNDNTTDFNISFNPNNLRCNNYNLNMSGTEYFGGESVGSGVVHNLSPCSTHMPMRTLHPIPPRLNPSNFQCRSECDHCCRAHLCATRKPLPRQIYSYADIPSRNHVHNNETALHANVYAPLPTFEQAFVRRRSGDSYCTYVYDPYAQYYEPVYDNPIEPREFGVEQMPLNAGDLITEEAENPYKKSRSCCTPAVCDSILESLRKSPQQDNDLILNIPFIAESAETTVTSSSTSRNNRTASAHNHHSPYRTNSHFGFNSPQREPQPDHKHIPTPSEPKKYVPLRKTISYEEIFSSPRYVDLCEHCFEKIVRLKPEIAHMHTHLRNLIDVVDDSNFCRATGGSCVNTAICRSSNEYGGINAWNEYVEYASSDTAETIPPFSSQLEPVLEVEEVEPDSADDVPHDAQSEADSRSSFIDKIMRLNYSEESTNISYNNTGNPVSSNLTMDTERAIFDGYEVSRREPYNPDLVAHYNTENEEETDVTDVNQQHEHIKKRSSIVEIWEFIQRCDNEPQQQAEKYASDLMGLTITEEIDENNATASKEKTMLLNAITDEAQTYDEVCVNDKKTNDFSNGLYVVEYVSDQQQNRALMSREERGRRKLIFQELWEDHITFLDSKERNSLSDTESAIDVQQLKEEGVNANNAENLAEVTEQVDTQQTQSPQEFETHNNDSNANPIIGDVINDACLPPDAIAAEIFTSRSIIVKHSETSIDQKSGHQVLNGSATGIIATAESVTSFRYDEKPMGSDGALSSRTYSVYNSQENLFFREHELDKTVTDTPLCGVDCDVSGVAVLPIGPNIAQTEADNIKVQCERKKIFVSQDQSLLLADPVVLQEENNVQKEPNEELTVLVNTDEVQSISCESHVQVAIEPEEVPAKPSFEESQHCKDKILTETKMDHSLSSSIDKLNMLDLEECFDQEFAELVESEAHEDLTKLNEEFEEILLRTENLECDNTELLSSAGSSLENLAFNPVERKILKKIKVHQLDEKEEIFDKIQTTIRNKLTPSKLEMMIAQQKATLSENGEFGKTFAASTPDKTNGAECCDVTPINGGVVQIFDSLSLISAEDSIQRLARTFQPTNSRKRLSRSLTPYRPKDSLHSTNLNHTTTPPTKLRKANVLDSAVCSEGDHNIDLKELQQTQSSPDIKHPRTTAAKRNFILENIRNAAKPRSSVRRLQGNPSSIFGTNPFGLTNHGEPNKRRQTPTYKSKKVNKSATDSKIPNQGCCDGNSDGATGSLSDNPTNINDSDVFLFQSKLVHGSSRYWVSLSQTTPQKLQSSTSKRIQKRHKKRRHTRYSVDLNDSTGSLDTMNDDSAVGVEGELKALNDQIQELHPRLETYKLKLQDYGEHVAKCSQNMDECIEVQDDIVAEQRQLHEEIKLNQYAEQIMCKVQTFSISEAED